VVLLRAVQEGLANVRKHARARLVRVRLSGSGTEAWVEVTDDGVGFDPDAPDDPPAPDASAGFGLAGMRDRVRAAGGELSLVSAPGEGTRVNVRLPIGPGSRP
jgi:signal transduction histidine kinase